MVGAEVVGAGSGIGLKRARESSQAGPETGWVSSLGRERTDGPRRVVSTDSVHPEMPRRGSCRANTLEGRPARVAGLGQRAWEHAKIRDGA